MRKKQHPLILAMNKFDALLGTLNGDNAEAFMAYVKNKVEVKRSPKYHPLRASPVLPVVKKSKQQKFAEQALKASTEGEMANVSAVGGSGD